MSASSKKILIMAGGTGGHVFPALATAKALNEQGVSIIWLGTKKGIESELVPAAGINIHYLSIEGLRGKSILSIAAAPLRIVTAVFQALRVIVKIKPDCVLGMGGFASGPGGFAAWILQKPLIIHEQNAVPGMTNKILTRFSKVVLEAFPNSFNANIDALVTGNPVRKEIFSVELPEIRLNKNKEKLKVLVVGGSLGALAINEILPKAIALMEKDLSLDVWHQSGRRHIEITKAGYKEKNIDARVDAFIEDMAQAYEWADVVVCRSGALTVSELAAAGVASILIPFPFAVDDHQTKNAGYLSKEGAAKLVQQKNLTPQWLCDVLSEMANDREQLVKMAVIAKKLGKPNATQNVADQCLALCG